MKLEFDIEQLTNIMKSFCLVTGMRIVIFTNDGDEILSYPEKGQPFCLKMQKNCFFLDACEKSNRLSFNKARDSNKIQIYHCHAGLVEASLPLIVNEQIVGYAMIGQITDIENNDDFRKIVLENIKKYGLTPSDEINDIKYFSTKKILASSDLLNACISFIITNQIITYKKETLLDKIDQFIKTNFENDVSSFSICKEFGMSRTSLYNLFRNAYKMGVSEYIMSLKILHAKQLLISSNLKINEIAALCGFNDYNYFTKVFKIKIGLSPRDYRHKNS